MDYYVRCLITFWSKLQGLKNDSIIRIKRNTMSSLLRMASGRSKPSVVAN